MKKNKRVDATFSRAFENYRPPENLTVSEWAAKYRVLSRESSAEAGPWRNERTPYLVEPMDAITDPTVRHITVVASSQVGKSEMELNAIGYIIDQDPGSILYIQPTLDDAKKFSRLRISPMARDCARLRTKIADVKSRDSGNTILQKTFPGGMPHHRWLSSPRLHWHPHRRGTSSAMNVTAGHYLRVPREILGHSQRLVPQHSIMPS